MLNYDKMKQRVEAARATGNRGDFTIADFRKIGNDAAHVLLEYSPTQGKVRGEDIERYFAKEFDGDLVPNMATACLKPNCTIFVVVEAKVEYRPLEDASDKSKMSEVLAGAMYLDNKLGDSWKVEEKDGKKVLARKHDEDIEKIIATRRNRIFVTQSSAVSLASLDDVNSKLLQGDEIAIFHKGKLEAATIEEAVKGGFRVKMGEKGEKQAIIAKESILDLIGLGGDHKTPDKAKLMKYYADAYGDKGYAKELVKDYK